MKPIRTVIIITLLLSLSSTAFAKKLTFGVVPQQSPLKLFKVWKPITDYLSKETGYEIVFKTERSIVTFENRLYNGRYDLAYMNPYHFVVAHREQNYQAAVRAEKMIRGILVAKGKDVDFDKMIRSKDTSYLFPSPNAFAATMLIKHELLDKYGVNIKAHADFDYVNSHDSVYSGIARGMGDLGGGILRTYKSFDKARDKDKLKIIYTTDAYPSHPIAYKPDLDPEVQKKLTAALMSIPDHLIKDLKIRKIILSTNEEFEVIRGLEEELPSVDC